MHTSGRPRGLSLEFRFAGRRQSRRRRIAGCGGDNQDIALDIPRLRHGPGRPPTPALASLVRRHSTQAPHRRNHRPN